jgi:hypothetical protein
MSKVDKLAKTALKNNIDLLPNHMNLHILHHYFSKKTNDPDQVRDPTKALSDASKHTSLNTTAKPTLK